MNPCVCQQHFYPHFWKHDRRIARLPSLLLSGYRTSQRSSSQSMISFPIASDHVFVVNCQPSVVNAASRVNVKSEICAVGLRSAGKHPTHASYQIISCSSLTYYNARMASCNKRPILEARRHQTLSGCELSCSKSGQRGADRNEDEPGGAV